MTALPQMTGIQYFGLVLAKYAVAAGQGSPAMTAFGGLVKPLTTWATDNLNQIWPSGSFARG